MRTAPNCPISTFDSPLNALGSEFSNALLISETRHTWERKKRFLWKSELKCSTKSIGGSRTGLRRPTKRQQEILPFSEVSIADCYGFYPVCCEEEAIGVAETGEGDEDPKVKRLVDSLSQLSYPLVQEFQNSPIEEFSSNSLSDEQTEFYQCAQIKEVEKTQVQSAPLSAHFSSPKTSSKKKRKRVGGNSPDPKRKRKRSLRLCTR